MSATAKQFQLNTNNYLRCGTSASRFRYTGESTNNVDLELADDIMNM